MADQKIISDSVHPSPFPGFPKKSREDAFSEEVESLKTPKPKLVVPPPPLPLEKTMEADDGFSPEKLRLLNTKDLRDLVVSELVELEVRKPKMDEWFRVHPNHEQRGGILDLQSAKKIFWVSQKMLPQVAHDPCFTFRLCVLCVTRQGVPFIWPVKACGNGDRYVRILFTAMTYGREKWTRLYWSNERQGYQVVTAAEILDAPKFPDKPFPELLKLAFKDKVISTPDHPAILNLKGKA